MSKSEPPIIAWDTCVRLDDLERLESNSTESEILRDMVDEADRSSVPIMIPPPMIVEVCRLKTSGGTESLLSRDQLEKFRAHMEQPAFDVRNVDYIAARCAQDLRLSGLTHGASLVLGCAVRHKAPVLLTRGGVNRKDKAKSQRKLTRHDLVLGDPKLRIISPVEWDAHVHGGQGRLPTQRLAEGS